MLCDYLRYSLKRWVFRKLGRNSCCPSFRRMLVPQWGCQDIEELWRFFWFCLIDWNSFFLLNQYWIYNKTRSQVIVFLLTFFDIFFFHDSTGVIKMLPHFPQDVLLSSSWHILYNPTGEDISDVNYHILVKYIHWLNKIKSTALLICIAVLVLYMAIKF